MKQINFNEAKELVQLPINCMSNDYYEVYHYTLIYTDREKTFTRSSFNNYGSEYTLEDLISIVVIYRAYEIKDNVITDNLVDIDITTYKVL